MRTISDLNNRVWYRAIKVFYTLCFLAGASILISLSSEGTFDGLDIPNSEVICQYGNEKRFLMKEIFGKTEIPDTLPTYFEGAESSEKILKVCEINGAIAEDTTSGGFHFVPDPYRIEEEYRMQLGYLLLSLLITIVVFEIIRRVFYYVVLGSIRPQK